MIVGKLKDLNRYKGINKNLDLAIDYALKTDLLSLPIGRMAIDSQNVYINRSRYIAKPFGETQAESHRNYLDLQIVLQGREGFGYTGLDNPTAKIIEPYAEGKDVIKYTVTDETDFVLEDGGFAIVFPEDIHRPAIKQNDVIVEKAVIKIKIA